MWGKSNPKPSQNTTVISFDCVCPSLGSIQLFHGGIENLLNRYATKVFVDRVFGCVTIVSIYFNKLPGGLFCCLETTCVTRETQVARQNKFGTIQRSFQYITHSDSKVVILWIRRIASTHFLEKITSHECCYNSHRDQFEFNIIWTLKYPMGKLRRIFFPVPRDRTAVRVIYWNSKDWTAATKLFYSSGMRAVNFAFVCNVWAQSRQSRASFENQRTAQWFSLHMAAGK